MFSKTTDKLFKKIVLNKTIVLGKKLSFSKSVVLENDPSSKTINDDILLTTVNNNTLLTTVNDDPFKEKYIFWSKNPRSEKITLFF